MPRINYNAPAMMNVNRMNYLDKAVGKSMQRISSGDRLTKAADDVAAHGVSERLRSQIKSLNASARNIQDGISLINVAEGALQEVHNMLHRVRELSVQAANGTTTHDDRQNISMEINKLRDEINYISQSTAFNGQQLLSGKGPWGGGGSDNTGGNLQINIGTAPNTDFIRHKIPNADPKSMGIEKGVDMYIEINPDTLYKIIDIEHGIVMDTERGTYTTMDINRDAIRYVEYDNLSVMTQEDAGRTIDVVMRAVDYVNAARADLGAISNRLEQSWNNTEKMVEDTTGHFSIIRDTDLAEEIMYLTRDQIIKQYSTAMLSQANQTPQSILQLLK
ncbi:MAG: flagellin [Chitinispirillales bacterium]|jgi:flagellin|nr:flagellin [Chitinispirillales bacterium]